jgi:transcription initiation factor TFIID TATA-box-binding protein
MYTNIVRMSDLGCPIDLKCLTLTQHNIRYNPRTFNAVIWQHPVIGGRCMVFAIGKMCVNGNAKTRVRKYARLIQKRGWPVMLKAIKIVTMSASYRTDETLSMDVLVRDMQATYEPELFAAAMFKSGGINFTCFRNGKILVTGICDERMMEELVMPTLI